MKCPFGISKCLSRRRHCRASPLELYQNKSMFYGENMKAMRFKLLIVGFFLSAVIVNLSAKTNPEIIYYESDVSGFNTRNFFYDNGEEVIAFDTQFTDGYAEKSIKFLRTKTKNPIKYLVITHPNPDKFNAIFTFKKMGAKVISSKKTADSLSSVYDYKKYYWTKIAKAFTDSNYPKLGKIDIQFDNEYDLKLKNGEIIKLTEFGTKGVSSNQTIGYIQGKNAFITGDLIHYKVHAWLEGGIINGKPIPDIKEWINTLNSLNKLANKDSIVYGGRGNETNLFEAVKEGTKYLKRSDELVARYIENLGSKKTELSNEKAGEHYQEIQRLFVKEFPDYQLPYMIGYGVYGLVNSKL